MLFGLCALSVLFTIPQMQASSTSALVDARQHQPPPAWLGASGSLCRVAARRSGLGRLAATRSRSASCKNHTWPANGCRQNRIRNGCNRPCLRPAARCCSCVCQMAPWPVWVGCLCVCLCCLWASCWSVRSARRSCCGSLHRRGADVGSVSGMVRRRWDSGWRAESADWWDRVPHESVLPRDGGGADGWAPSYPLHAAVSESATSKQLSRAAIPAAAETTRCSGST
jgi:hypothetical protein